MPGPQLNRSTVLNRWGVSLAAAAVVALSAYATNLSAAPKSSGGAVAESSAPRAASDTAQSRTANKPVTSAKRKPRMPAHFNKVIDDAQREKILAILLEFAPKIDQKRAELETLTEQRNEAVFSVLTPEQRKQVEAFRAESLAKSRATREASSSEDGDQ